MLFLIVSSQSIYYKHMIASLNLQRIIRQFNDKEYDNKVRLFGNKVIHSKELKNQINTSKCFFNYKLSVYSFAKSLLNRFNKTTSKGTY